MSGNSPETSAKSSRLKRSLQAVAIFALLIAMGTLVALKDHKKGKVRGDFTLYSLAASRVIMAGGNPYDKSQVSHNYKYFPANAIIVYPFNAVPVPVAQGMWFSINLGLIIWAFSSLRHMLRPTRIPWWVLAITLAVTFRLIVMNLRLGQWNTSVFCLSIIGLRYIHSGRNWGGVLLGLAAVLKFIPLIFLPYLAVRRRWKDLGVTCGAIFFWIVLLPIITLGPSHTMELIKYYYGESTTRVERITGGPEIGSHSVHSSLYRTISPVAIEVKGTYYRINVLNLPIDQGGIVVMAFSVLMILLVFGWMFWQTRGARNLTVTPIGTLLLIGICYSLWYTVAPGVRHGQLINTTPPVYALAASTVFLSGRSRTIMFAGLAIIFCLYLAPAQLVKGTTYNHMAEVYNTLGYAIALQLGLGIFAFGKVGRSREAEPGNQIEAPSGAGQVAPTV